MAANIYNIFAEINVENEENYLNENEDLSDFYDNSSECNSGSSILRNTIQLLFKTHII